MSEKLRSHAQESKTLNPRGLEKASNQLLSENAIQKLLDRYGSHGLERGGGFFVIKHKDGSRKSYFHLWVSIPHAERSGTGEQTRHKLIGGTPIELFIGNELGIKIADEDRVLK